MSRNTDFRVGLIGLGHQATDTHIPGILSSTRAKLVAVCDSDLQKLSRVSESLGINGYGDYRDLLNSESLDFVTIAVPHHLHMQVLEAAALRGVHVLKEKPLATCMNDAIRIAQLATSTGIHVMTAMQRRLQPVYQSYWELRRHLGTPFFIDARYHFFIAHPSAGWRGDSKSAGGGCIIDMGYHLIDIIVWYFGLPHQINSQLSMSAEPRKSYDAEDTATIQFSYRSGLHGILTLSRYYAPKTETVSVVGSEGQLVLDALTNSSLLLVGGNGPQVIQYPSKPGPSALIDQFCDVLAGERNSIGTPDEHLMHMTFISKCYPQHNSLGAPFTTDIEDRHAQLPCD